MISKGGQKLNLNNQNLSEESEGLNLFYSKYPNITELDLTNNNFKSLPKEMLQWKELISLDIRNNPFENFEEIVESISFFPNLSDLKIDLTDQNQVLMLLSQIPKLVLLNGSSTKDAVTIVDLDEKDIESISLQNELPCFNDIVMKLNDNYKDNSDQFINEYQVKLNDEAAKVKNCLSNNVPNYIYATNVIQSQISIQRLISDRFIDYLKKSNPDDALLAKSLISSVFKSGDTIIELLNNLYPKIEDKIETLRNQLEDALKAADEIADYEEKFKSANKEKSLLAKQYESEKELNLAKIEKLEAENKLITDKLIQNAKEIIHTASKPMISRPNITSVNNNNNQIITTTTNYNQEHPQTEIQSQNAKFPFMNVNANNPILNNQPQSHSNLSQNNMPTSNQGNSMSNLLNQTSSRVLTIKMMKDIINEIYSSKVDYDKKCIDNRLPRETMEQHMYTYLNQKYGLKNLIIEWASSIINGIKLYSGEDSDINLFGKILRNEQEEDSRLILSNLKTTVIELLEYFHKSKNTFKSTKEIKKIVEAKKEGQLSVQEWRNIIYYIYEENDASSLENFIIVFINKQATKSNTTSNIPSEKKLTREEMFNLTKQKEEMNISFKDFMRIVSDFQIKTREKYLRNFVKIFRKSDKDCDGILNENEFISLIRLIPYCKGNIDEYSFKYLSIIDPNNNKKITFSECVSLFSMEMIDSKEEEGNPGTTSLLDKICLEELLD